MNAESRTAYYSHPEKYIRDVLTSAPTIPQRLAMFYEEHIPDIALIGLTGSALLAVGIGANQPLLAAIGSAILVADFAVGVPSMICYVAEAT